MLYKIEYEDGEKDEITIQLDPQDTWSADITLAPLIAALLKQLKCNDVASPFVDDEDVPSSFHLGSDQYGWPVNGHERWHWVLDEMIWAFSIHTDWEADKEFFESTFNQDGLKAFCARKQNAFRLFGKYYQNLWE